MSQLIKVAGWTDELRANVVFVHGLDGHAYNTWRRGSRKQSFWPLWLAQDQTFWPLWLAQDIEGIAVYTLNYPAPLSNWLGTAMPLQDRAVNVLECLLGDSSFRAKPITFICHSLGGLIIKQMMLDLQQQQGRRPQAAELLEQVRQVIFIATPHAGSRKATWLDRARFLAWPSAIARSLAANDSKLRQINTSYRGLADDRREKLRHLIFYETQGTPAGVIVDEASSDPGLPGDPPIPIDANHITIAKPINRTALLYVRTRDFISEYPEQRQRTAFYACQLPTIRSEQQWNLIPKLLRIAALVIVLIIAFKGVQALVSSPAFDEKKVAERLAEAQKPLNEKLEGLLVLMAREKGVEVAPLRAILSKMGEMGIPDEDIPKRLNEKADELVRLRTEIGRLRQGPAPLVSFAEQAQTLIDKGDLDGARAAFAKGRVAARTVRKLSSYYEGAFRAQTSGLRRTPGGLECVLCGRFSPKLPTLRF